MQKFTPQRLTDASPRKKPASRNTFERLAIWRHHRVAPAIEYLREEYSCWLADIPALPGVTAYGRTKKHPAVAVQALALRLIADRLDHGEAFPGPMNVSFIAA